jgi:hypothetical protein
MTEPAVQVRRVGAAVPAELRVAVVEDGVAFWVRVDLPPGTLEALSADEALERYFRPLWVALQIERDKAREGR